MAYFYEEIGPYITLQLLETIAKTYKLSGPVRGVHIFGGWQNTNVLFSCAGKQYVFRFYRQVPRRKKQIMQQHAIISFLAYHWYPVAVPMPNKNKKILQGLTLNGIKVYVVLYPFVGGKTYDHITFGKLKIIGASLAKLHHHLSQFNGHNIPVWQRHVEYRTIKRRLTKALKKHAMLYQDVLPLKQFNAAFVADFMVIKQAFGSHNALFRVTQPIHGDFQQRNLKFRGNQISGIFDFDDIMRAPANIDLAKTIALVTLSQPETKFTEPKTVLLKITQGYQTVRPLSEAEKNLLPILVRYFTWKEAAWLLAEPLTDEQYGFHRILLGRCWYGICALHAVKIK